MEHDLRLRAAARAIYDACYPSEEWAPVILRDAAQRSVDMSVGTIEVRLALHVLRPFVREQALLTDYWKAATLEPRHPWNSCHKPYRAIVERLVAMKADVEPDNLP